MSEPYRTIEVRPLSGSIGAEIRGADLARLNQETYAEIHRAWLEHLVAVFPDQKLTQDDQIAFARRFGPVMVDPFIKSPEGKPELMVVVKDKHERKAFGESWHSDNAYLDKPPMASFLYGVEVPAYGGDTLFANQYLAYETLSAGLRATLDGLTGVFGPHAYAAAIDSRSYGADRTMKLRDDSSVAETLSRETEHPIVRTHPETGRKALYVNSSYTLRFKGWTAEESKPLLDFLYRHASRPEFTCRVRWAPGTLTMWDNRCALHHPINDYHGQRRVMHRVTAEGDRPF
ncbi:MAG TPA: TauD/TfdA family dioxygenase [Candidatus Sulfotelmatobacter sp.]|nr:TauD/TfdA family dioxygenase [Candidatus Sulfotelmatobacter sp.]